MKVTLAKSREFRRWKFLSATIRNSPSTWMKLRDTPNFLNAKSLIFILRVTTAFTASDLSAVFHFSADYRPSSLRRVARHRAKKYQRARWELAANKPEFIPLNHPEVGTSLGERRCGCSIRKTIRRLCCRRERKCDSGQSVAKSSTDGQNESNRDSRRLLNDRARSWPLLSSRVWSFAGRSAGSACVPSGESFGRERRAGRRFGNYVWRITNSIRRRSSDCMVWRRFRSANWFNVAASGASGLRSQW